MAAALRFLDDDSRTRVGRVSSLYRTPPWGKTDQPDFINAAAEIATTRDARELLELCLDAERRLKRVRAERWGPRLIDLDILTFGDSSVREPGLELPHPRLSERAFVLVPLLELAPDLAIGGRSVRAMLDAIDGSGIEKLPGGDGWRKPGSASA
ncbi:MAG: 2-amino-4-hydroxy-6-hydroxymethyldihydropteridine diphosphokinase [Rhizobiaceae bacterium]|nr:2-amino-4-hydroxy-6-hydroxymethyldihydropteridine diphosphokinase [Rhizobiaceae bacterium]